MSAPTQRGERVRIVWWLLCLLPAGLLVAVTAARWVDAPLPDDVDAILDVANRMRAGGSGEDGAWRRIGLLLEPHVDHRIVPTRAAAALQLAWLGHLDLRGLALPGLVALLASGALLPWLRAAPRGLVLAAAAPVCWLLFQPQAYDALLSPSVGANLVVVPFAAGALLALRRDGLAGLALGAGLALCAVFSQGNGVAVLPAALLSLWLARRPGAAGGWLVVCVVLGALYLSGRTSSRPAALSPMLADPLGSIRYGLAFLGSAPGLGSAPASIGAGLAMLGFLGVRAARGDPRRSPWLWGALLFVLLSIAANTLGRAELGVDYAVSQPRYRAYSALCLALCHLVAFERWGVWRGYRLAALGLAVAFSGASYASSLADARALSERAARNLAGFAVTGRWAAHPRPDHASAVLARSQALGTFVADPDALARHLHGIVDRGRDLPAPTDEVSATLSRVESGGGFTRLEGHLEPGGLAGLDPGRLRAYLVLDGGERIVGTRLSTARTSGGSPALRFRTLAPAQVLPVRAVRGNVGLLLVDGRLEVLARVAPVSAPARGPGATPPRARQGPVKESLGTHAEPLPTRRPLLELRSGGPSLRARLRRP